MFCRFCGKEIPADSNFCPYCGSVLASDAPQAGEAAAPDVPHQTQVFQFSKHTTYDQASLSLNEWLSEHEVRILSAHYTLDSTLLAGVLVPEVEQVVLEWVPEPTERRYQFAVMLDERCDFGLGKRHGARNLQRQFDHWKAEHPELEVAGKVEQSLSLGWSSAWVTLFFYR
jgi:hypothetical protein